ncbi:hypothetical protein Tco_1229354 [Tanacetum coccineum]
MTNHPSLTTVTARNYTYERMWPTLVDGCFPWDSSNTSKSFLQELLHVPSHNLRELLHDQVIPRAISSQNSQMAYAQIFKSDNPTFRQLSTGSYSWAQDRAVWGKILITTFLLDPSPRENHLANDSIPVDR